MLLLGIVLGLGLELDLGVFLRSGLSWTMTELRFCLGLQSGFRVRDMFRISFRVRTQIRPVPKRSVLVMARVKD